MMDITADRKKVVVIGMGLIGGSIALSLKKAGIKVTGLDLDEKVLELVQKKGIEAYHLESHGMAEKTALPAIFTDAKAIFLSIPVSHISDVIKLIAKYVPQGTVITDTGSVKKMVVQEAEALLVDKAAFVGGHPMAGSENSGFEWAREDMFSGVPYIITPTANTNAEALWTTIKLVERIRAKPVLMSPEEHDKIIAALSHLPQVISTTLVNTVAEVYPNNRILNLSGGGWRDTTRIAGSNAVMWKDILISNKDEILPLISAFKEQLSILESAIRKCDEAVIKEKLNNSKIYNKR